MKTFKDDVRALALRHSLWRRANVRNVSFETLYGRQFTLSTQFIISNYLVTLTHRRSNTVTKKKIKLPPLSSNIQIDHHSKFKKNKQFWSELPIVFSARKALSSKVIVTDIQQPKKKERSIPDPQNSNAFSLFILDWNTIIAKSFQNIKLSTTI